MPIVLERNNSTTAAAAASNYNNHDHDHLIGRSGFGGTKMTCFSIYGNDNSTKNSPPEFSLGGVGVGERGKVLEVESSSSTSSIGRNSDDESSAGRSSEGGDGEEVQSKYKGGGGAAAAFENLEALEEVLPMKRSISQFYCGKSKSFTNLVDAKSCSSIKDIVKPENALTRKRKNLLAHSNFWDKNRNGIRRSSSGVISKRHSSRSSLALAATMACTETINNSDSSSSNSPSLGSCLPPLPPQARRVSNNDSSSSHPEQKFSPWRSFSLSDLQGVAATASISDVMIDNKQK